MSKMETDCGTTTCSSSCSEILNTVIHNQIPAPGTILASYQSPNRPNYISELDHKFKNPTTNLLRSKNTEEIHLESVGIQLRKIIPNRRWKKKEMRLYDPFIESRKNGKTLRIGWFRRSSQQLWATTYSRLNNSSGLYLAFFINKVSKLLIDYENVIIDW